MAIFRNYCVTMVFTIVAAVGVGVDRFSATSGTGKLCRPACVVRRVVCSGGDGVCDSWDPPVEPT